MHENISLRNILNIDLSRTLILELGKKHNFVVLRFSVKKSKQISFSLGTKFRGLAFIGKSRKLVPQVQLYFNFWIFKVYIDFADIHFV